MLSLTGNVTLGKLLTMNLPSKSEFGLIPAKEIPTRAWVIFIQQAHPMGAGKGGWTWFRGVRN